LQLQQSWALQANIEELWDTVGVHRDAHSRDMRAHCINTPVQNWQLHSMVVGIKDRQAWRPRPQPIRVGGIQPQLAYTSTFGVQLNTC